MKPYLEAGEFVTTHGIHGELRLYPWCDGPSFLSQFSTLYLDEGGQKKLAVDSIRPHKNICIVKLAGIASIEAARPLIGQTVYIARADVQLPEGTHFVQDLLGAAVFDADTGEEYGTIAAITRPGRHDIYEIERPGGGTALFPATEPFWVSADIPGGRVLVRPIPGMFEDTPTAAPKPPKKRKSKAGEGYE